MAGRKIGKARDTRKSALTIYDGFADKFAIPMSVARWILAMAVLYWYITFARGF
jgi:hypothetical protein